MVYPDGIWYRIQQMEDAEKILEQHLIGGRPVMELIHRRLQSPAPGGVAAAAGGPSRATA
jgi:(2Fe-2S) ferredoxin